MPSVTRRQFLVGSGLAGVGLALGNLTPLAPPCAAAADALPLSGLKAYGDWRDVYRQQWT